MTDFDILKVLFNRNILNDICSKNSNSFVVLKEDGADAKLRHVEIWYVGDDCVLLKVDTEKRLNSIFDSSRGELKCCDYIMFAHIDSVKYVLFLELKSRSPGSKEIIEKFKGSECFIDYCNSLLNRFHEQDNILGEYQKRFVVFYKQSMVKNHFVHKKEL